MAQSPGVRLGRHGFGLAAILFVVVAFVWRDFSDAQQIPLLAKAPHHAILACVLATIEMLGGAAIQWRKTARVGAGALAALYFFFALLWLTVFLTPPLAYLNLGNFFEQFSMGSGAMMVFASLGSKDSTPAAQFVRVGYFSFAACVVSFAIEQINFLPATASLVPKWIPPGQMFWAIATTMAFALAAIALLSGYGALLASRLLTAMLIAFGLLVWFPRCFQDPHRLLNWSENVENLAIAGAAWIVFDHLSQKRAAPDSIQT